MIEAGRDIAFVSPRATTNKPYLHERIIAFYESVLSLERIYRRIQYTQGIL